MIEVLKKELNFGDYEIGQLSTYTDEVLKKAYRLLLRRNITGPKFRYYLKLCDVIENELANETVKKPSTEPTFTKKEKKEGSGAKPKWQSHKQLTQEERLKNLQSNLARYKELNEIKPTPQLRTAIEQTTAAIERISGLKETVSAKDIANGIQTFIKEEHLNKLAVFMGEEKAKKYRDAALRNWLLRDYDIQDEEDRLAEVVINKYKKKLNNIQISSTTNDIVRVESFIDEDENRETEFEFI